MDSGEVGRSLGRAKAARDFHAPLHHAQIAFGLVVTVWHDSAVQEAQRVVATGQEPQQLIMSGSPRRTAPGFAAAFRRGPRQRRLVFVEGETRRDNRVKSALYAGNERVRRMMKSLGPRGPWQAAFQGHHEQRA